MNKSRLEAFSDGVFSIVITLLVFDIKVPELPLPVDNTALWHALGLLWPIFGIYVISFAVLSVLWINHHFIFHTFARSVDRWLNLLNLAYLLFVVFVPFSARLIGTYPHSEPAAIIYGVNIFLIVFIARAMISYIKKHPDLFHPDVSQRMINQSRFRSSLSLFCYLIGIALSFVSVPLSIFFYLFPTIFNIIPGTLDLAERFFKFSLD